MQILDSLVEGMELLPDERDQKDYIWGVVKVLETGEVPQRLRKIPMAMLTSNLPAIVRSRERALAGAAGGSKAASKREANAEANGQANAEANGQANAKGIGIGIGIGEEQVPPKPPKGGGERPTAVIEDAVAYLNAKTGSHYRPTASKAVKAISERVREGYTLDDMKRAVDRQCAQWLGTDKAVYLRPETVFGAKMDGYCNGPDVVPRPQRQEEDPEVLRLAHAKNWPVSYARQVVEHQRQEDANGRQ